MNFPTITSMALGGLITISVDNPSSEWWDVTTRYSGAAPDTPEGPQSPYISKRMAQRPPRLLNLSPDQKTKKTHKILDFV